MTMSKIGLKLANGEFYAVLDEGLPARKRLVVTTVQDGQKSVQIDIYRGQGPTVAGAEYAGSLVVENIPFAPRGEPDIRLDLALDAEGRLAAYAEELSSGEHQSIELSLEALTEENSYEIPDFAFTEETDSLPEEASSSPRAETGRPKAETDIFGEEEAPPGEEEAFALPSFESPYSGEEIAENRPVEAKRKRRLLPILLFVILILALLLGGAWLVNHFILQPMSGAASLATPPAPTVQVAPAPAAAQVPVQPAPEPAAAPAVQPAAVQPAAPPPKQAAAAPAAAAKNPGVYYKLRWGDTLWDLSYTYYRNPWLFGKLVKANKIKNPDFIIAGKTIWIPPR
jgi:hypothetical protein